MKLANYRSAPVETTENFKKWLTVITRADSDSEDGLINKPRNV